MRKNKIERFKGKLIYIYLILLIIIKCKYNMEFRFTIYFAIFFILIFIAYKKYKLNSYKKLEFSQIDKLKGEDFEEYLQYIYSKLGYKVKLTNLTADYGADLILLRRRRKIVLQAKRWSSKVGVSAIQEVVASRNYYKAKEAIVVTNNYFTKNAENLALANDVELIDRKKLKELIKEIS